MSDNIQATPLCWNEKGWEEVVTDHFGSWNNRFGWECVHINHLLEEARERLKRCTLAEFSQVVSRVDKWEEDFDSMHAWSAKFAAEFPEI